jgi:hypothetical protein
MIIQVFCLGTLTLLSLVTAVQPVSAQQWGVLYPDGSIRQRGIIIDGPDPYRILNERLTLPLNRRTFDPDSFSIYRGGILESGPNPMMRLRVCMQTGLYC